MHGVSPRWFAHDALGSMKAVLCGAAPLRWGGSLCVLAFEVMFLYHPINFWSSPDLKQRCHVLTFCSLFLALWVSAFTKALEAVRTWNRLLMGCSENFIALWRWTGGSSSVSLWPRMSAVCGRCPDTFILQLGVVGWELFWATPAEGWHWDVFCPHDTPSGVWCLGWVPQHWGIWGLRAIWREPWGWAEDWSTSPWRRTNSHKHRQICNSTVIVNALLSISEVSTARRTASSGPWDEDRSCWVALRRQPSFLHAYTPFLSLLCIDKEISISCMWGSARLFADILSNAPCMS